jgi:hypothetical protein
VRAASRRSPGGGRRARLRACARRSALLASALLWLPPAAAATELPTTGEELLATLRGAIESRDYERIEALVNWEGAGTIKRRVVAFQIRHGLGRPIRAIVLEPIPADGLDAVALATVGLKPNMALSERVRVVYDEPPVAASGKPPASVFLVGLEDGAYRIGLVIQSFDDDDDDD